MGLRSCRSLEVWLSNEPSFDSPRATDESATESLRSDIVSGVFTPRERLPEIELASRYGVSRASIRAALIEMEREGLVERRPNRGAQVRAVSLDEAIEITEVRMVLEGLCAAKAAELATASQREELERLMAEMKTAVGEGEGVRYAQLNRSLHAKIRELSGHKKATQIIELLRNQLVQHQFRLAMLPGRPEVSVHEHDRIVRAIVAGNADEAEQAMRAHLRSVREALRTSHELSRAQAV